MRSLLLALVLSPVPAGTQTGPAPVLAGRPAVPVPARCARPLADYDKILKRLAQSMAQGAYPGGKSAQLRSTEEGNLAALGESIDLTGCGRPLPLSPEPYLLAAMRCERVQRLPKAPASPPACDMASWKPFAE